LSSVFSLGAVNRSTKIIIMNRKTSSDRRPVKIRSDSKAPSFREGADKKLSAPWEKVKGVGCGRRAVTTVDYQ